MIIESFDISNTPERRIQYLIDILNTINQGERKPTEHVHKNDEEMRYILSQINENDIPPLPNGVMRLGIIVGNGSVLSALPNIPVDFIIMIDNNGFVHEWTRKSVEALQSSKTPQEYQLRMYSPMNPLYQEMIQAGYKPEDDLNRELRDLDHLHFLSSQERFSICKTYSGNKRIFTATVDLRSDELLQKIGEGIQSIPGQITFANLTNVWEHAGDLSRTLRLLPFAEDAIMLASSRAYTNRFYPRMLGLMRGLGEYIDNAKAAYNLWRIKVNQRNY